MQSVLAERAVSVSELKRNPTAVLNDAGDGAVAVLNHNRVMGYIIPADVFEALIDRLDDLELAEIARARLNDKGVSVSLDDL